MKLEERARQLVELPWCEDVVIQSKRRFEKDNIKDHRPEMYVHTPNELDYNTAIHDIAEMFPELSFKKDYYKQEWGHPYIYMQAYNDDVRVVGIIHVSESAINEIAGCEMVSHEYTSKSYSYSCKVK